MKITKVNTPNDQYYKYKTKKSQIVLHHTVSPSNNAWGDINYWLSDKRHVGTAYIIDSKGRIYEFFNPKYWGHAIGLKRSVLKRLDFADWKTRNVTLNKGSIQIELDSLGPVNNKGESVAYGAKYKAKEIVSYKDGFRGYKHFEKYSPKQLESLKELLEHLCSNFDIDKTYNPDMWDVSKEAIGGKNGIYTHVSYRSDKSDCHPQKELIEILKSL